MNGKSFLAATTCLVVAALLVRAVGAPFAPFATGATGATGPTGAALRHALVTGGCGGAPVWLAFDYPADWWLQDDADGMIVQTGDPSVVRYGGDFAKAVIAVCPKGFVSGPPPQVHTAMPVTLAGAPTQLYGVEDPDAPEAGGLFLRADIAIDGSPVFFDGFVQDSDDTAARAAHRAALDALLASVHRVAAPAPDPMWRTATVTLAGGDGGAPSLAVDVLLPPLWAVAGSADGRSAVIGPIPGPSGPAPGGSSDAATGLGVRLERVDDPVAAGWDAGHPWLSQRLLDATTLYLPGRDGAPDTWLAGDRTLAVRIGPAADASSGPAADGVSNVLADPLALHIVRHASLRLIDVHGDPAPWPSIDPGYPEP